ncbi:MAG TPA: prolyl oligopeptidase family serine peptidase [Gemmatimonadaceae bacterium]|nr:prolyl oligopeptidase family serine peptidase [Gemmatimonadaceae bacterium]
MKRLLTSALASLAVIAAGQRPAGAQDADPFLWLEDVEGARALQWVQERNAKTLAELTTHPVYQPIYDRVLSIYNSRDRIAFPSIMGDRLYNFWQDDTHKRGIWRRTTWESYLSGTPRWEVILDIDSLAAAEKVNWSYGGSTCLAPEYVRCLVRLSRGGSDAVQIREFDLGTKQFVANGFALPEAKQSVAWVHRDTLLVATDYGPGSMTSSGYARQAKRWPRGTPLSSASLLYEGDTSHVMVAVGSFRTADRDFTIVFHRPSFFEGTMHLLRDGKLVKVDVPLDADVNMVRDQIVVYVRKPWTVGGTTHEPGSLIAMQLDEFLAGNRSFQTVVAPGPRETVNGVSATKDYLLVSMLNNVKGELRRYRFADGRWTHETVPAPEMGSIRLSSTSPLTNRYFFTYAGYTQPTTLYLAEENGSPRQVAAMPAMFDAGGLKVAQYEATSTDGTKIPYFVVHREQMALDGTNPTLLYAYGGFEVSQTPGYSATVGSAWLERGGVYVVANIRGGGEFGPQWHRAGLKENRQRVYDDFLAVAQDLIDRKITSPDHLGIRGGSNGGLLVGVAYTQKPELFDAVVVSVPLFDMQRYNKLLAGASWMAEYGNPDIPEEWEYISKYSPYQNIKPGQKYPRVLFTTTTRDDRVHPGHARKGAAKMESLGYPVYYFENTEGGHGSGVTNEQRARMDAVVYTYLWKQLGEAVEKVSGIRE